MLRLPSPGSTRPRWPVPSPRAHRHQGEPTRRELAYPRTKLGETDARAVCPSGTCDPSGDECDAERPSPAAGARTTRGPADVAAARAPTANGSKAADAIGNALSVDIAVSTREADARTPPLARRPRANAALPAPMLRRSKVSVGRTGPKPNRHATGHHAGEAQKKTTAVRLLVHLDEKMTLGLAAPPAQRVPVES